MCMATLHAGVRMGSSIVMISLPMLMYVYPSGINMADYTERTGQLYKWVMNGLNGSNMGHITEMMDLFVCTATSASSGAGMEYAIALPDQLLYTQMGVSRIRCQVAPLRGHGRRFLCSCNWLTSRRTCWNDSALDKNHRLASVSMVSPSRITWSAFK